MKKSVIALILLLATACGYRAPMYKTVITEDPGQFVSINEEYRELAALVTSDTGMPPTDSNTLCIITDHHQKWEILNRDLESAEKSVYIDNYSFHQDSCGTIVAGILKEKRARGTDVRIIVDKAAHSRKEQATLKNFNRDSIHTRLFYQPSWLQDFIWPSIAPHRDHRKIVLIDGQTGYIGGRNIRDKYFLSWRDADLRINGPAVKDMGDVYMDNQRRVAPELPDIDVTRQSALRAVCDSVPGAYMFRGKTIQIVPESPWDKRLPIRNCFEWAINHAREYFYFYNPYTPPPASTLKALKTAAARGVDVRWIVPANNDIVAEKWMGESLYKELLKAGIRIFEWQGDMNHTKQFISDDQIMAIGSANMDNLSFFLNLEVEAIVYDREVAVSARELYLEDTRTRCREITLDDVRHWNIFRRLWNSFTRFAVGSIA